MVQNEDVSVYEAGMIGAPSPCAFAGRTKRGFTVIEILLVLSIAAILLGIVTPHLLESSTFVALTNARSEISSSVSLARATATRHGRVAYLVLDVAMDRIRVDIDTSFVGGQPPVTVHSLDLWGELAVDLQATEPLLCFDSRGLSVTIGACPGTGAVIYVRRGGVVDSVAVSSTGRISE